jgi:uncharacterized membrane protein (DUF485 family)
LADLFHHLLFVPLIGGVNFAYPWGVAGNILSFFISGLPGGIDYLMLAAVKTGHLDSYTEKRVNCSINTWIRGPGITAFIIIVTGFWLKPPPDTKPEDLMPAWLFFTSCAVIFFNGQFYAQRVIGNVSVLRHATTNAQWPAKPLPTPAQSHTRMRMKKHRVCLASRVSALRTASAVLYPQSAGLPAAGHQDRRPSCELKCELRTTRQPTVAFLLTYLRELKTTRLPAVALRVAQPRSQRKCL